MRNNLIPTSVVDKNGKRTTVHKLGSAPAPSAGRLGSIKPSLGTVTKKAKTSKVSYYLGENTVPDGSFLHRAGLSIAVAKHMGEVGHKGSVEVSDEKLYGFLRVGIPLTEAGILYALGYRDVESLMADPQVAGALPGDLVSTYRWGGSKGDDRSIEGVVDYLAGGGVSPQKIAKAVRNNLNDNMLENSVLTPEQLADLFTRYTYSVSINEEKGTSASRLMDAIVEGRMPYSISEKKYGVDRAIASQINDTLYPSNKKDRESMSEDIRNKLKNDPKKILQVGQVITAHKFYQADRYQVAWESIEKHGREAAIKYSPDLLEARLRDNTALGIQGAEEAIEALDRLRSLIGNQRGDSLNGRGNKYSVHSLTLGITPMRAVYASDLVEMKRAGVQVDDILPYLREGLDSQRIVAVVKENVPKSVSSGWL